MRKAGHPSITYGQNGLFLARWPHGAIGGETMVLYDTETSLILINEDRFGPVKPVTVLYI